MDKHTIDMLVTKTMAAILRHVTVEDGEVCVNNQGLDALRAAFTELTRDRPRDDGTEIAMGGEPGASAGASE